eukprot:m.964536 g.964536  ORF g.964536 m.964536 type:complete len:52 (+) comp23903_c0_seq4:2426-2581(+)
MTHTSWSLFLTYAQSNIPINTRHKTKHVEASQQPATPHTCPGLRVSTETVD